MPSSTITAPGEFANTFGDLGHAHVFAMEELQIAIMERLSMLPFVRLYGDLAGTGSDTMRVGYVDGVGWDEAFTAMATEDESITPSGWVQGYSAVTVARYGLGKSGTYFNELLSRPDAVTLDRLKALLPGSIEATIRSLACTAGAGITGATGLATAAWDVDYHLALIQYYNELDGYDGQPVDCFMHSEQVTDLRNALRAEPAFQFPMEFREQQAARGFGYQFSIGNTNIYQTNDVTQSGGGHQGFSGVRGFLGRAIASTAGLAVENPQSAIFLPEAGLVVEEKTDGGQSGTRQWFANLFTGVALADSNVVPQRRILSIDD